MSTVLLESRSLCCGYGKKNVISCDSLQLVAGGILCLIGPNGSGKSTLIKTLSGFTQPLSGSVFVSGKNASLLPASQRVRHIATVPQEFPSDSTFTVFDMVLMGRAPHLGLRSTPAQSDCLAAFQALSLLGLHDLAEKRFDQLSGGQKRLTIIARALAMESEIILLDEPDSGLDVANRLILWSALKTCAAAGKAILLSTHNYDCVAELGALVLCASDGKAVLEQTLSTKILSALYGVPFCALEGLRGGLTRFIPDIEGDYK